MSLFLAVDDTDQGAPLARCGPREAMCLFAPDSCASIPNSVPPLLTFSRSHYTWLALCLAGSDDSDEAVAALSQFMYGTHTLTWAAMHSVVAQAVNAGFMVVNPSDIVHAIKSALEWASMHVSALRRLLPNDFELLPVMPDVAWWRMTPFPLWSLDGTYHPLCHAIGYSGLFWDAVSRGPDTRFHLSLLLTQEFIPVSASVPTVLYGEPAIRFYASTMIPLASCVFPRPYRVS